MAGELAHKTSFVEMGIIQRWFDSKHVLMSCIQARHTTNSFHADTKCAGFLLSNIGECWRDLIPSKRHAGWKHVI